MTIRAEINKLVSRDGEIQESKLWANVFKAAALYILLRFPEKAMEDWAVLATLLVIGVAPDLLKKIITMRARNV